MKVSIVVTSYHVRKRCVVRLVVRPLAWAALHALLFAVFQEEPVVVHHLDE